MDLIVLEKRILNKDASGSSPLRKKSSKLPINDKNINAEMMRPSWNTRIRKLRPIINEHRNNLDFEAWSREIWGLGNWWLEVAGEEVAGIVADLIDEFKREFSQAKGILMIPIISGNLYLDQLLAKSLVTTLTIYDFDFFIVLFLFLCVYFILF